MKEDDPIMKQEGQTSWQLQVLEGMLWVFTLIGVPAAVYVVMTNSRGLTRWGTLMAVHTNCYCRAGYLVTSMAVSLADDDLYWCRLCEWRALRALLWFYPGSRPAHATRSRSLWALLRAEVAVDRAPGDRGLFGECRHPPHDRYDCDAAT